MLRPSVTGSPFAGGALRCGVPGGVLGPVLCEAFRFDPTPSNLVLNLFRLSPTMTDARRFQHNDGETAGQTRTVAS